MEGAENADWFLENEEKNFGLENREKNKLLIMTFACRSCFIYFMYNSRADR
jgi:hypothetical protein